MALEQLTIDHRVRLMEAAVRASGKRPAAAVGPGCLIAAQPESASYEERYLDMVDLVLSSGGAEREIHSANTGTGKPPARWLRFLSEVMESQEDIDLLQEFAGYCFFPAIEFKRTLILSGQGMGKSTIVKILRDIVGSSRCTQLDPTQFESSLELAYLVNSLINSAYIQTTEWLSSARFKSLSNGDYLTAAFKHEESFSFIPSCKFVFTSNEITRADILGSRPLSARVIFIGLDKFPDPTPDLLVKLFPEIPAIRRWALEGLLRLLERGQFSENR